MPLECCVAAMVYPAAWLIPNICTLTSRKIGWQIFSGKQLQGATYRQ
jgi:hypothetical protein